MSTAYIAVMSNSDDSTDRLEAYLYGSTEIDSYVLKASEFGGRSRLFAILKTTTSNPDHVNALGVATYQAGRLQSGMFFASVQETRADALDVLTQLEDSLSGALFTVVAKGTVDA